MAQIFNKDLRSVCIFGTVPITYYLYDYALSVYTDYWATYNRVATEFLPFFICAIFMTFCCIYYNEYELKSKAEQKEQIIRISVEQQSKEISSVKKNYEEIRLLRHDMRLLLNNVALCIENAEKEKALEMISTYSTHIEGTKLERFCSNDTVNYVLSDFSAKCSTNHIHFKHDISFFSILSNILDNALNAQLELPEADRYVKLLLKSSDGKIPDPSTSICRWASCCK